MARLLTLTIIALAVGLTGCMATAPVQDDAEAAARRRQEAQQYYSIGADHFGRRSYDDALANWEKALEVDPTYYDTYIGLGTLWRRRRDPVQAKNYYLKAVALEPTNAKGYEAMGDLYLEMAPTDPTLIDSALAIYRQGLERDPQMVPLYNGIAEAFIMKEQPAQADSVYGIALGLFPDDLGVQRLWGEFLYDQRRYAETVTALRPVVERFASDPNINKLREKLALAMAEEKMYTEAIAQLNLIIEADPTNVDAMLVQGVIQSRQKKYREAMATFQAVLAQDADRAMARVYMADIEIERRNYGAARNHLQAALARNPNLTVAHVYLGDVARRQGTEQIGGRALANVRTDNLRSAKSFYEAARRSYQQGLNDRSYASYCRGQISFLNQSIELIDGELFIR
ncbi:MAG TPA: tetratricopeptide repeat protein [candidate division WOR-3 bacterium]|mgnify:CR=1 FL=1|uniref:Tetratricopeptide repeat protein n=1 Tax=candidate division WOR-3 bacterium TaxID=2052148 RepID=A0A7V0XF20_UNCW3|nr:tetratricopeptide repeat protein [candidate division WOR-3 bacterium]